MWTFTPGYHVFLGGGGMVVRILIWKESRTNGGKIADMESHLLSYMWRMNMSYCHTTQVQCSSLGWSGLIWSWNIALDISPFNDALPRHTLCFVPVLCYQMVYTCIYPIWDNKPPKEVGSDPQWKCLNRLHHHTWWLLWKLCRPFVVLWCLKLTKSTFDYIVCKNW